MILPTKNISPDRALLTIAGQIFARLDGACTVSGVWDEFRTKQQSRPIAYGWFILAVDLLFLMGLVWLDQDGLLRRNVGRE
ncbi:ABC-three component system middle component 6 [Asaia bogorensis]|uniref:Uncharacterized protein n=1 Tax=Asaia bogorensis NBRC 16594 TaxID=1231624 RepID=A0AAN4R0T3_9PROT|nr:ABC-three component system middle component 6 [Asaia bogorensis]GEL52698.1 hypothetical protein ABO01nite_07050 [Asaia bogorensis NBRC 16594]